ncbi:MAG TPA: serine hydrolase domain-containing protein [Verrucomicrobiae bacterium]
MKLLFRCLTAAVWLLAALAAFSSEADAADYAVAVGRLEQAVREEMTAWGITGISVALVDEQETVYAAGFGEAKRESAFRCGSISKLFNAVAVMQLVEAGKLDLDMPLERVDAGLVPINPFTNPAPVTLRQLLCHRSGMFRESPVGGYFDDTQPGLTRMTASVPQGVLVNPPNTKTRYSNVGPSIAGRAVELVSGMTFREYQRQHILGPLAMTNSAWTVKDLRPGQLVQAYMRVADGHGGFVRRCAPVFDLGTIPAGNLFTTAGDLARFIAMLAAEGRAPGGCILKPESLTQMFTPQLTSEPTGFGLGFLVGKFREHPCISHNGAVYGHSSSLVFLPDVKIGAVVLGNEDVVNARIQKLANLALSLMLEAKRGEEPPPVPPALDLSAETLAAFAGDYQSQSFWAKLEVKERRLIANISGQATRLTAIEPLRFLADSRVSDAAPLTFVRNDKGEATGFTMGVQKFARVAPGGPEIPSDWRPYLGSYGPGFIPLVVSWRNGHLYAMTENMADYRLTPVNRYVFAFPPGLYADEHLVFLSGRQGKPRRVDLANMILKRR